MNIVLFLILIIVLLFVAIQIKKQIDLKKEITKYQLTESTVGAKQVNVDAFTVQARTAKAGANILSLFGK